MGKCEPAGEAQTNLTAYQVVRGAGLEAPLLHGLGVTLKQEASLSVHFLICEVAGL